MRYKNEKNIKKNKPFQAFDGNFIFESVKDPAFDINNPDIYVITVLSMINVSNVIMTNLALLTIYNLFLFLVTACLLCPMISC